MNAELVPVTPSLVEHVSGLGPTRRVQVLVAAWLAGCDRSEYHAPDTAS